MESVTTLQWHWDLIELAPVHKTAGASAIKIFTKILDKALCDILSSGLPRHVRRD